MSSTEQQLRTQHGASTVAVVTVLTVVSAIVFWVAVESNLLTRKSTEFSIERFRTVEAGDRIEDVEALLGEPLLERPIPEGDWATDPGRTVYYFMGDAPRWWPFYTEAMIVADENGVVVRKLLNEEP